MLKIFVAGTGSVPTWIHSGGNVRCPCGHCSRESKTVPPPPTTLAWEVGRQEENDPPWVIKGVLKILSRGNLHIPQLDTEHLEDEANITLWRSNKHTLMAHTMLGEAYICWHHKLLRQLLRWWPPPRKRHQNCTLNPGLATGSWIEKPPECLPASQT